MLDALGCIGPDATRVLTRELGRTGDPWAQAHAARALGKAGPKAVDPLIAALAHGSGVCREAVWSLAEIGPPARSAAPALKKALADDDYVVRVAAAAALKRILGEH